MALPLSPKQIDFIANSDARINLASGSIRAGKTISTLLRWLIYCASAPRGGELVVIAKTLNTAVSNVFLPLTDTALFGDLARHVHYTRGAPTATILGRPVRVIGANDARAEERLRGMTCAGALVDEATLVSPEFWTQLLGRMSVPGAKLFGSTNPGNAQHWLRKNYILKPNLDLRHWRFTIDDNPSLDPQYVASIKSEFSGVFYERFIEGRWTSGFGAIYDMFDPALHVVDILPPIERWIGLGIDVGTTNPTHGVLVGLGVDRVLYAVAEYRYDSREQHRQLTDAEYSKRIREWLQQVPIPATRRQDGHWLRGVTPEYVVVDPSAASFRLQLHHDGLNNIAADNEVLDGIRVVSSLFASGRLKIHKSCTALLDELASYSWDERAALLGEDKPTKADDHGCDGLRYAIKTTRSLWHDRVNLAA